MKRKRVFMFCVLSLLALCLAGPAQAQNDEDRKFEIGGQVTAIGIDDYDVTGGFGGRFGYHLNRHVTLEAEGNFFPGHNSGDGEHKVQGFFGLKAGRRFKHVGIFAKARPGFMYFNNRGVNFSSASGCAGVFPVPTNCITFSGRTAFAADLGVVFEVYPTKNTILRFDAGDTVLRFGGRTVPVTGGTVRVDGYTTHSGQVSAGFGYRF